MSKHVAPHRWADARAGELGSAEIAEMEQHAATCTRCDRARVRVQRASDTFPVIRQKPSPELGWDGVRARIHWTISKEKRDTASHPKLARRRPLWPLLAATALVAGATGAYFFVARAPSSSRPMPAALAHAPELVTAPPINALISRLAGDVMIDGVRPTDPFAKPLGAGTVLATGDGRIDLQFGEASAFALGPRSTLELRAFDANTITLVVDGTVDLEVAPRQPGQRFLVIAGDRTIEVRGTRFTVKHDTAGTLVSCQHGLVAVRDTSAPAIDTVEVATARKAFVAAGHHTIEAHAVPLTADELVTLANATPWSTPGWTADLATRSAALDVVAAAPQRAVRVDGTELGAAPFAMRVAPGRHTIEAADAYGKLRKAGWVDVTAAKPAHFEALPIDDAPSAPVGNAIAIRKRQLAANLDHARLRQCTRRLAKSGLTGTYVTYEITVGAGGAVDVLNVVDTDLPTDTAACVHDALAAVHFVAGGAATWRDRLAL